jgi:hypothetical protein
VARAFGGLVVNVGHPLQTGLALAPESVARRGMRQGDPVRLAGTLYGPYDKDTYIDRIAGMLDELDACQRAG